MKQNSSKTYDVLIIGAGPAGSTAALTLARRNRSVLLLDKHAFPRFHVGESFLPSGFELLKKLRLEDRMSEVCHLPKFGAEFGFGGGTETTCFTFDQTLHNEGCETFNAERSSFDLMLLNAAREAGAEAQIPSSVKKVNRLSDGDVSIETDKGSVHGRYLLDASGQSTFLAKQLGLRKGLEHHRKVAYFGHFENVERLPGDAEGHPTIAMCDEGWFWMISIDRTRTSIGMVLDSDIARTIDQPASNMLAWGIARCPLVRERMKNAVYPKSTHTIADFSYYCRPFAGPGFFLLGDAAFFLDPIFSSGISIGMEGAVKAAGLVDELLESRDTGISHPSNRTPETLRAEYARFLDESSAPFLQMVNLFYDHSFREMFLLGKGPFQMHKAAISVLAGYVFPRPAWSLRWRIWLLRQFVRLQHKTKLVPSREHFSLLQQAPEETRVENPRTAPARNVTAPHMNRSRFAKQDQMH